MKEDVYAIQKVEAAEAAKSLPRRITEEWIWWTLKFAVFVVFCFFTSDKPDILPWLKSTIGGVDPAGFFEPFKKWMFLLALYVILYVCRVLALVKGAK